jgi:transposase
MPAPLSLDIRKRIVAAVEGGASRRAAAERFAVSESSAVKLMKHWEQTGSLEPGQIGRPSNVCVGGPRGLGARADCRGA